MTTPMDINFDCPRCGQNIPVDEEGAGTKVECPTCKGQITVPTKIAPPVTPQPTIGSTPASPVSVFAKSPDLYIERRSGWSLCLKIIGSICLAGGVIAFLFTLGNGSGNRSAAGFVPLFIGVGGCIQSFFCAFLIDVFTDIRWFLKKLVDARNV